MVPPSPPPRTANAVRSLATERLENPPLALFRAHPGGFHTPDLNVRELSFFRLRHFVSRVAFRTPAAKARARKIDGTPVLEPGIADLENLGLRSYWR
jgi:hypothetical protein